MLKVGIGRVRSSPPLFWYQSPHKTSKKFSDASQVISDVMSTLIIDLNKAIDSYLLKRNAEPNISN